MAWPLALAYAALIVFASLFPFEDWRAQGIAPWEFLFAPLPPPYWTGFDIGINIAGYAPLGFLLTLGWLRREGTRPTLALTLAVALAGALLSLGMEFLQIYLPQRVPSNLDGLLNTAGTWLGALLAWLLQRLGVLERWSRWRARWFSAQARGPLVLLMLWPAALLFPAALPFGLGQVLERLEAAVAQAVEDSAFYDWLPQSLQPLEPLARSTEALCVALGLWLPCLLAYSVVAHRGRRLALALAVFVVGVGVTALSCALTWGPLHAWVWLGALPVRVGLLAGALLALLALPLSGRACAALLLLATVVHLSLLNQAPTSPYFAHTLQLWEQGRFLRFYGLSQWLGWLWPYAVLVVVLLRLSQREGQTYNPSP